MKFIILGNDFLPVGTRDEQQAAAAALRKAGVLRAVEYQGAHTNCDPTGRVLQCDGSS